MTENQSSLEDGKDALRLEKEAFYTKLWEEIRSGKLSQREFVETQVTRDLQYETLAEHDPLTGLLNRRGFITRLDLALREETRILTEQGTRTDGTRAILFFDLDDFGEVNKLFGDIQGDRTLQTLADILNTIRPTDIAARRGGEEFVAYTEDGLNDAVLMAERLQNLVNTVISFPDPNRRQGVTIGIALIPAGLTPLELASEGFRHQLVEDTIDQASQTMRIGKKAGKNSITVRLHDGTIQQAIVETDQLDPAIKKVTYSAPQLKLL